MHAHSTTVAELMTPEPMTLAPAQRAAVTSEAAVEGDPALFGRGP